MEKVIVFRMNDGQGPELLHQVFLERGWSEFEEDSQDEYDWNIWWKSSRFRNCDYEQLMPWQRLNHYPKSTGITRKDALARNLKRMKGIYGGAVFNFSPIAFNLPNDYTRYVAEYTRLKQNSDVKNLLWICKPADLSRGRGIFIFKDLSELQYDCNAVVQRYITNPLLISGYKFDIRIYVAVPSFHPLSVYVYQEGIVRFGTEKFDLNNTSNIFAHLTNTSINKHSPSYSTEKEHVGPGCKWTLNQLRYYFHQHCINDAKVWKRVVNVVILTLLTQAPMVTKTDNCFELYGFDILIDENLKPWLLEVNFSPALSSDCQVDITVKKQMLHDLMDMMNFKTSDSDRGGETFRLPLNKSQSNFIPDRNTPISRLSRVNSLQKLSLPLGNRMTSALESKEHSSGFMQMADSDEGDSKPIFGLPLVHQSDDEGCSSDKEDEKEAEIKTPQSVRKGRSETSLPTSSSSASRSYSDSRSRDSSMYESRSARSDRMSPRKSGYKLRKVHSKGSSISDSGFSSYSGSSENSDSIAKFERSYVYGNLQDLSLDNQENGNPEAQEEKATPRKMQDSKRQSVKRYGYSAIFKKSNRPFKSVSQLTTVTRGRHNVFSRSVNNDDQSASDDASQTTSTSSPTPTRFVRRRRSQISVSDMTQIRKKATIPKTTSQYSNPVSNPPLGKPFQRQTGEPKKIAIRPQRKQFSFSKPPPPKGPKPVIGNFFLVFPFNDATRRASAMTLDSRVVIRETQKALKEAIAKTGTSNDSEYPKLWAPLKPVEKS